MAHSEHPEDDRGPWTQPGFLAAAGVIALLAILGVVVALSGGGGESTRSAPPAAPPAPREPTDVGNASACDLPVGNASVPTSGLPDTRWELVGSMAAPTAPETHGPARTVDGFRTCFAHTPTGALYAAVNLWAASTAAPAAEVLSTLGADTPVRPEAVRDAREQGADVRLDDEGTLQVAGFNFVSYDENNASINLAFRLENGGLLRIPAAVRWEDGDWKYVIPPAGDPGAGQLKDLSGYVEWAGA